MPVTFSLSFAKLILYYAACASCALAIRRFTRISEEPYRKILHLILIGSAFVLLYAFDTWQGAAIAAVVFAVIIFPVLSLAEHLKGYSKLLAERNGGEIKRSLVEVFGMFAATIALCWGLLGAKYLALAVILGWGLGDGAAALVGKAFGKHRLEGKYIDGKKSLEGSLAMFAVSFAAIITVLISHSALPWHGYIPVAAASAMVCAVVELHTKNGLDTLTCPAAALAVMLPLIHLWGGAI
ncbi:MAG: phosphatidate cytidylyltransferase [Oscillospiraceae bacterium]|jgi:dolichol kinase|nr:phosphatidate cytidylyltransferase [Oscillospiraceae bacterium]